MKTKKIIIASLIALIGLSLTSLSLTFSWFMAENNNLNIQETDGGVITQYFHCGDGSENDPFVITRPVHLYNMTELYDKLPGFASENYYFQLGYDLENNGNLEFYSYNDEGKIVENSYSSSLNMNYYSEFRPIGSETKSFGGVFDGSNLTINNLTISGENKSDIGVFGYVNEDASIKNLYINNLTINVDNAIATQHNVHNNAYVGYLAGHIDDATCFENTYVNNCKIEGNSCHIKNDWGYFGYCANASTIEQFIMKAKGQGEEDTWGGSFNSKTYTNLLYNLNHSTTAATTNTFSGDGGYVVTKTASATTNPNNNQVVYRLRDGSYIPLKFSDDSHTQAAIGNTGYLVGSNIGTGANASPKISSYKMVNLQNALTNTQSTNMADTYRANNIAYEDSKLEILTYQNGWKRIRDSHNENNNSTNRAITNYTKTNLDSFNFHKYVDSRNALQEVLESSAFLHGIHFDNNAISTSSLLSVPANTIRVNGKKVTTSYQLPKGSIDFNLKEEGLINFFAGTYNSSDVNLNFFSLYEVTRNNSGNIISLTQIKKIYTATSGDGYVYQTGNNKPSDAGDLVFDVETILHGNAPVKNMMYYFEIPVNAGEYAMGVAGSTQGAYMIYLDLGANGGQEQELTTVDDFETVEYRSSPNITEHSILLITYEQYSNQEINIQVAFIDNKYYITLTHNLNDVIVTILSVDYDVFVNNQLLSNEINSYHITN